MRLEAVTECEHGRLEPHLVQGDGWPNEKCYAGSRRVASTTDLIEELKVRGARENRRNSQSVTLTCALDGETVGADDQLVEAIRQLLWDMRNRGTYEAKARAVYELFSLEGEKP